MRLLTDREIENADLHYRVETLLISKSEEMWGMRLHEAKAMSHSTAKISSQASQLRKDANFGSCGGNREHGTVKPLNTETLTLAEISRACSSRARTGARSRDRDIVVGSTLRSPYRFYPSHRGRRLS